MPDSALTIGEVINLLKEEFPDVSVSKVRFLEDQGLIHPGRSRSGYRQFHENDLKRLRYILRLQRDHFLPLKVIKSKLTMWDRGEEPATSSPDGAPRLPRDLGDPDGEYDADRLTAQSGLNSAQYRSLIEHGLLPEQGPYHDDHLAICVEAGRLIGLGLEARHLRSVLLAAARASDLLATLTEPLRRHRSPDAIRRAQEAMSIGAESFENLYQLFLSDELREARPQ
ncbi:MAG: MerR family transcriptional regulator [Acidimicrobiia bacterium]|nr:MerR family transcriptional regulator [Acidimicrobiia bacterium]